jgi:uncharacterized protein (DUF2147 family)
MKYLQIFVFIFMSQLLVAQKQIVGIWKNLDDEDGKEKSHIEIYEKDGKLKAKVIKLLPAATMKTCSECKGALKNKPIEGMEIVWGLKKYTEKEYSDGEILNPKTGKIYSCSILLESQDKLKVRGFLGFSMIGKTQYWYRVK